MQQEKFRKLVLNTAVAASLAGAAAIAGFLIGGGGTPSAKSLADFKTWQAQQTQAQQTRQEGHGAAQPGQVAP